MADKPLVPGRLGRPKKCKVHDLGPELRGCGGRFNYRVCKLCGKWISKSRRDMRKARQYK